MMVPTTSTMPSTAAASAASAASMTRESSISSHASFTTMLRHNEYFRRSSQSLCSCNNAEELENNQFLTDVDLLPVPPPPILSLNRKPLQSSSVNTTLSATSTTTATATTTPKHMNHNKHTTTNSSTTAITNSNTTTATIPSASLQPQQHQHHNHHHHQHPPANSTTYHKKSASCNSSTLNCATKCVLESDIRLCNAGIGGGVGGSSVSTLINACTGGTCGGDEGGSSNGNGGGGSSTGSTATCCLATREPTAAIAKPSTSTAAMSNSSTATMPAMAVPMSTTTTTTPERRHQLHQLPVQQHQHNSLKRASSKKLHSQFDLIACGLDENSTQLLMHNNIAASNNEQMAQHQHQRVSVADTDGGDFLYYNHNGSLHSAHFANAFKPPFDPHHGTNHAQHNSKHGTMATSASNHRQSSQARSHSLHNRKHTSNSTGCPANTVKPYARTPLTPRQFHRQHTLPNCTGSKYHLTHLLSPFDGPHDRDLVQCLRQSTVTLASIASGGLGALGASCARVGPQQQHQQYHYEHKAFRDRFDSSGSSAGVQLKEPNHQHKHHPNNPNPNKSQSLNSLLCDDQHTLPCSNSLVDLDYPLYAATKRHNSHQYHDHNHHLHHNSQISTPPLPPPPPPPATIPLQQQQQQPQPHQNHHFSCSLGGVDSLLAYAQFDMNGDAQYRHAHEHHQHHPQNQYLHLTNGGHDATGLLDLKTRMTMCDDSFYGSNMCLDMHGNSIGGGGSMRGKHQHLHNNQQQQLQQQHQQQQHHLQHHGSLHRHQTSLQDSGGDGDTTGLRAGHALVHMYGSGTGCEQQQCHQHQHNSNNNIPWRHRQCPSVGSSNSSTTIARWNPTKHWLAVTSILLIVGAVGVAVPLALRVSDGAPFEERLRVANQLLDTVPLIDGHNDLPWNIRKFLHNQINDFNFDVNLTTVKPWSRSNWSHTDLFRLKKGKVSAQFWAAYVPCEAQHKDAVQQTLEQIDVIIRLTDKYRPKLTMCNSAFDIVEAHKNQQLCSFAGVEGGHSIGGSLSVLRMFYALGVRYMTLTSTCHTTWADCSSADAPKFDAKHGGLTEHGKTIVREMNRIGMIVDLSHVSVMTMRDTLATSEAPVIFSHSSAYALCNSSRNVQDDILRLVAQNGGLVMVNLYSMFLTCSESASVHDVVAHINHIKQVAGVDHVGIGAGFDGINHTPSGLADVSAYPVLFSELLGGGWTADDLAKLAGQNFIRVLAEVEALRDKKKTAGLRPYEDVLNMRTDDPFNCTSS